MAAQITGRDIVVLEEIARRYRLRNILGSCPQRTAASDAELFAETIDRVCARIKEIAAEQTK